MFFIRDSFLSKLNLKLNIHPPLPFKYFVCIWTIHLKYTSCYYYHGALAFACIIDSYYDGDKVGIHMCTNIKFPSFKLFLSLYFWLKYFFFCFLTFYGWVTVKKEVWAALFVWMSSYLRFCMSWTCGIEQDIWVNKDYANFNMICLVLRLLFLKYMDVFSL